MLVVWCYSFSPCLILSLFLPFCAFGVGGGARWIDRFDVLVDRNLWVNSGLICFIRIDFCAVGVVFVLG